MKKIKSILVIDDNPNDREIAMINLEESGQYEHVMVASDGSEAIELYKNYEESKKRLPDKFPPLIISLDINMPIMNGFDFLDALYAIGMQDVHPNVVIMVTSSDFVEDVKRAKAHPLVNGYLVKPFTLEHAQDLAEQYGAEA